MRCEGCGTENRADRRFCRQCGTALVFACPECGAANEPGDRFCGACGAAFEGRSPQPEHREGAERRMLSILFADLVGFTPRAETRDPEEVRELLGRYFETTREIVERYGGTLEKFIGDAVVAVWGAPLAQEDDAERAVRTALELVAAVAELGEANGVTLALRIGISTGSGAVTLGAVGQGMVAGDIVNTTARIQTAAQPGTVLVDEATRRATEASIAYEGAGSFELKGKSEPIDLWQARRVVAARRGEGRSDGLEPPFVGRARELSLLKQLLHATGQDGRAHMVAVSGIGGICKSRLTWEFEKYIDGLVDDFLWHRGRCLAYGDGVAFWALAEIVRMRCRIVEEEDDETAAGKLDETLEEFLEPDDRDSVREPLRQLLGLGSQPDGDRNRLFPAWRLFIERMTATAPVVLVFEDLQWADSALLEFIDYLMEWSRHHPLFVLTLSRPEVAEDRPALSFAARGMTALTLEPLTEEEMAQLVGGLVPGAPGDLVERVVDAAEGVPLYAVEMVRMLLDRGYLAREGDRLVATGDLGTLEIPETLHALVAARLDALPDQERRLVEDAAVLGKTFTANGLAAVSGLSEPELEPLLGTLVRREVLTLQTDPRSPERGQYAFVQAIVRTIAYETIGRRERKRRHLASARHLESTGGEELTEVVAAHYVDAYRLAPDDDDAAEIRDQALRTLVRAAERAASLAAPGEAERLIGAAIDLTEDDRERAALLERAGIFALTDGQPATADGRLTEAAAVFERLGDVHAAARINARRAEALFLDGRVVEAVAQMEPAYTVLREQEQDGDLAALAAQFGRMLGFTNRMAEAPEPLERALVIAERLGQWDTISAALNTKALHLLSRGRRQEGETLLAGALRVALEHGMMYDTLRAYFNLGFAAGERDEYATAYDADGLELARRIGDRQWERSFLLHQAGDAFVCGRWDDSITLATEAIEGADDQFSMGALVYPVSSVLAYRGDADGAADAIRRAGWDRHVGDAQSLAIWAGSEGVRLMAAERWAEAREAAALWEEGERSIGFDHPAVKYAYWVWTTCSYRLGDTAAVRSFVDRISSLTPTERTPFHEAQRLRFVALLGDSEHPAVELVAAADILRGLRMKFQLMLVQADAAVVLAPSDPVAADAALAEARELVEEIGAVTVGRQLDAIGPAGKTAAQA